MIKKIKYAIIVMLIIANVMGSSSVNAAEISRVNNVRTREVTKTFKSIKDASLATTKLKYISGYKISWKKQKKVTGYNVYVYYPVTKNWKKIKTTKKNHKKEAKQMKNSPTEVKKKETEERKRQEELEKQKRNETYQLLGGSQNDSDADDDSSLAGNIQQLENSRSFDSDKTLASLKLAPKDRKNGESIYRQQKMNVTDISCGYDRMNGQRLGQIEATFQTGRDIFGVTLLFSHEEVTYARCGCPECHRKYWGWYSDNSRC